MEDYKIRDFTEKEFEFTDPNIQAIWNEGDFEIEVFEIDEVFENDDDDDDDDIDTYIELQLMEKIEEDC